MIKTYHFIILITKIFNLIKILNKKEGIEYEYRAVNLLKSEQLDDEYSMSFIIKNLLNIYLRKFKKWNGSSSGFDY